MLVKHDAGERIELADPGRARQYRPRMRIAGVPALLDAIRAEVDVLGMGFAIELRREQAHHMHPGLAAITCQFARRSAAALGFRQVRDKLVDDVTQPVDLLLPHDLAGDPAGILHILVPVEHFRHGGRLRARRIPQVDGEDQRVLARIVVEHGLRRRIR
jgi:hypothetical protein